MRKPSVCVLVFLIAAVVAAAAAQTAQVEWKQYAYASDGFAVSAPVQPSFSRQDKPTATGNVEMHNYTIELGHNSGVMISSAQLQGQQTASPKAILQKAKDGALAAVNAKLTSEHEIALQGFPGVEFDAANDQFHTRVRMYLVNARLITMMALAPKESGFPAGADRILDSLKLLKVPAEK